MYKRVVAYIIKNMKKYFLALLFCFVCAVLKAEKVQDVLRPLSPGSTQIHGWIGNRMDITIGNRVMVQDIEKLVFPFRERKNGSWDTEYWGKWFTSMAYTYWYRPTEVHRKKMDEAIEALLDTQTSDGQITGFAPKDQLGRNWDLWGRKYALHGLILHYDMTGDKKSLNAARKAADYIADRVEQGMNIAEQCVDWHGGIQSTAILTEFSQLYERTGNERYRKVAENILSQSEKPNAINARGLKLLSDPLKGVRPSEMSSLKSYEVLTNYEGLYELFHATGKYSYLEGLEAFLKQIREHELMIHGSLSNNEYWCDGTTRQSAFLERPTETCATSEWMIICYDMLKLTGKPEWADLLETTLYNALAGAMLPNGHWWAYFSGFNTERVPCPMHHGRQAMTCCVASGPRGLMLTSLWAVMQDDDGLVVNLYGESSAREKLKDGTEVWINQRGDYPHSEKVTLEISPDKSVSFNLRLRIPAWSQKTELLVNGDVVQCKAGEYVEIDRVWSAGDKIELTFDMRGRVIKAPGDVNSMAIARGPVLLSLDNRTVRPDDCRALYLDTEGNGYIELEEVEAPENIWMAYKVPVYTINGPQRPTMSEPLVFFDYPSAGNLFLGSNVFLTWISQPLFLPSAFPKDSWKLYGERTRPYVPFGKQLDLAADVTEILRQMINDGTLSCVVSSDIFNCDPCPGKNKVLTVHYLIGGKQSNFSVSDGEVLSLKLFEKDNTSVKLLSAKYGLQK